MNRTGQHRGTGMGDGSPETRNGGSARVSATFVLLLGVGLGALTGFTEFGLLFAIGQLGDRMVFLGRHAVWMRPATEATVFVAIGLLIVAFFRARGRPARIDVTLGIYVLLATVAIGSRSRGVTCDPSFEVQCTTS